MRNLLAIKVVNTLLQSKSVIEIFTLAMRPDIYLLINNLVHTFDRALRIKHSWCRTNINRLPAVWLNTVTTHIAEIHHYWHHTISVVLTKSHPFIHLFIMELRVCLIVTCLLALAAHTNAKLVDKPDKASKVAPLAAKYILSNSTSLITFVGFHITSEW